MVVCIPGTTIETVTERVERTLGLVKGGCVLVQEGNSNVEREGTTAIVRKFMQLEH